MWFVLAVISIVLGTLSKLEYDRKPDRYTDPKRHRLERKVCALVVLVGFVIFIIAFASGVMAGLKN